jgi:hypothetical protein
MIARVKKDCKSLRPRLTDNRCMEHFIDYKTVSDKDIDAIYKATSSSELFHQVFNLYKNEIFRGRLSASLNNGKSSARSSTSQFDQSLNDTWVPELHRAVLELLRYGLCIILYTDKQTFKILPAHEYTIKYKQNPSNVYDRDYKVFFKNSQPTMGFDVAKPVPFTQVFVNDHPETSSGAINSVCKVVLGHIQRLNDLFTDFSHANALAAYPDYAVVAQESRKMETDVLQNVDFKSGDNDTGLFGQEIRIQRSREEIDKATDSLYRSVTTKSFNSKEPSSLANQPYWQRRDPLILGLNQQLAPFPLPSVSSLLDAIMERVVEQILLPFGLNYSYLYCKFTGQSSSSEASAESKRRIDMMCLQWQKVLCRLMKQMYFTLYEDSHLKEIAYTLGQKEEHVISDAELQQAVADIQVEFTFDYIPLIDFTTLKGLYDTGLMTLDTFQKYAFALYSIPLYGVEPVTDMREMEREASRKGAAFNKS